MERRYSETARKFDEELGEDLTQLDVAKTAKRVEPEAESGIQRIAKGKTPLDEVRAIIDSSRAKSAEEEIREHRVREKLSEIKGRGPTLVNEFINTAKNNGE